MRNSIAYIGLGANLGNSIETIRAAINELGSIRSSRVTHVSSLYITAPVDATGDDFVNAVVELTTQLKPTELLFELQKLEHHFGRTRPYQNAPRTLDLDLLLYDQQIVSTEQLQVPHPRMTERAFVIVPLLEIAPDVVIPSVGKASGLFLSLQGQVVKKIT